ncbi:MAG: PilN domain-containing protein [Planctomycetota bacterium]|nr:PilN domain-containing protein [Planctomycetota bacterium]
MSNNASFLPEDYLARKAERRTNLICLVLFAVVMLGVFLAFMVTNQKWSQVKRDQMTINSSYQTVAEEIRELTELQEQKDEMLHKAELAAALVERVPRSILLAELVNRMPDRLSLLEFDLTSEKIKPVIRRVSSGDEDDNRLKARRGKTKEEAAEEVQKIRPPRYRVSVALVGVAPTDMEVSQYLAELNTYPLFEEVTLEYSEEKEIEGQVMRKFEIKLRLDPDADVRRVDPLARPRGIRNPMSDELKFTTPILPGSSAGASGPSGRTGD